MSVKEDRQFSIINFYSKHGKTTYETLDTFFSPKKDTSCQGSGVGKTGWRRYPNRGNISPSPSLNLDFFSLPRVDITGLHYHSPLLLRFTAMQLNDPEISKWYAKFSVRKYKINKNPSWWIARISKILANITKMCIVYKILLALKEKKTHQSSESVSGDCFLFSQPSRP